MERVTGPGPKLDELRALFVEYWQQVGFCGCFQGFDKEVAQLPEGYAALFLEPGEACAALRLLDAKTAEMKRLYVRGSARGKGLGRRLALAVIAEARERGCERVVLDTVPGKMDAAIALYRALGFRDTPPYTKDPVPGAICLELRLT